LILAKFNLDYQLNLQILQIIYH